MAASFFYACQDKPFKKDFVIDEKDLIPEGIAVDSKTGIIYVGSTYKRKIVQINPKGEVSDFIPQEKDSIWSVLGMEVDEENNMLWVNTAHIHEVMPLINPLETKDWLTTISAFDLSNKKLIKKYQLNDTTSAFNDLTLSENGDVYATESANNKILKKFNFPNGITYSKRHNVLFVSTREGILKIDIDSKQHELLPTTKNINAKSIDGLTLFNNYLIGHQNSKVSKFYLNDEFTEIVNSEILDSGKEFDASTTGEVAHGDYYFIVNSQLSSGIDFETKRTKPLDSLEKIIIRKINL
jgi:hypothetical protein